MKQQNYSRINLRSEKISTGSIDTLLSFDRESGLSIDKATERYPEISRETSILVVALLPTQVSVEGHFSSLRLLRSDQRASMSESLIEALLSLRENY